MVPWKKASSLISKMMKDGKSFRLRNTPHNMRISFLGTLNLTSFQQAQVPKAHWLYQSNLVWTVCVWSNFIAKEHQDAVLFTRLLKLWQKVWYLISIKFWAKSIMKHFFLKCFSVEMIVKVTLYLALSPVLYIVYLKQSSSSKSAGWASEKDHFRNLSI